MVGGVETGSFEVEDVLLPDDDLLDEILPVAVEVCVLI